MAAQLGKQRQADRVEPQLSSPAAPAPAGGFLEDPQKAKAKAVTGSFRQVAENFLVRHVRSQSEIERVLRMQVYPRWENRPFEEIKRSDVADLLDIVEDENGPRAADTVLAIIRKMTVTASRSASAGSAMTKSACCGSLAAASVTFRGAAVRRDSCRPFCLKSRIDAGF